MQMNAMVHKTPHFESDAFRPTLEWGFALIAAGREGE
jgi:hypothetical protein